MAARAKGLGGLSENGVDKGVQWTRTLPAAAHLGRKTVLGDEPAAFVKLLKPEQRDWFTDKDLKRGSPPGASSPASPAETGESSTDVIKMRGGAALGTYQARHPRRRQRAALPRVGPAGRLGRLGASATPARCDVDDGCIHPHDVGFPRRQGLRRALGPRTRWRTSRSTTGNVGRRSPRDSA
ncbi:hypothetical protein [Nonomuraea diastatica]|uniref:Uncharacterized protein n=1 Tax=Nonomuraea diastatica TaxID=1848329 RepID=A0A4R4WRB2_9ACTN|nr:hypothetical protein [Nonomuraea diastatica]TDD17840.1 hypothetical protein E1294_26420 [Nonomuraea diastatica]